MSNNTQFEIKSGMRFTNVDFTRVPLGSQLRKKLEGRDVLVTRVFKRMGADQHSFDCLFLRKNNKSRDYEHTFLESKEFAKALQSAVLVPAE